MTETRNNDDVAVSPEQVAQVFEWARQFLQFRSAGPHRDDALQIVNRVERSRASSVSRDTRQPVGWVILGSDGIIASGWYKNREHAVEDAARLDRDPRWIGRGVTNRVGELYEELSAIDAAMSDTPDGAETTEENP